MDRFWSIIRKSRRKIYELLNSNLNFKLELMLVEKLKTNFGRFTISFNIDDPNRLKWWMKFNINLFFSQSFQPFRESSYQEVSEKSCLRFYFLHNFSVGAFPKCSHWFRKRHGRAAQFNFSHFCDRTGNNVKILEFPLLIKYVTVVDDCQNFFICHSQQENDFTQNGFVDGRKVY